MGITPHSFLKIMEKALKDLTISDVTEMLKYYVNLEKAMIDAKVYFSTLPDGYKRNVIDRLTEKGVYQTRKMKRLYTAAMNKELKGYSAAERKFILKVGNAAFMKTMKELIKDEEARNDSDRAN